MLTYLCDTVVEKPDKRVSLKWNSPNIGILMSFVVCISCIYSPLLSPYNDYNTSKLQFVKLI